jgi:predicted nucleotidyltransferase component of viral defense system
MNSEKVKHIRRALKKVAEEIPQLQINELRVILALERVIARMASHSALSQHLIFKGGFVLFKQFESSRFTRDADALAIAISKPKLKDMVAQALMMDLDDGLWFGDIQIKELQEQGECGAYRFVCAFQIGEPEKRKIHKLPRVHIDIGFSDNLLSDPPPQQMLSILQDVEPVSWKVYSPEQIISEKLETLFQRGVENSRAKDVYDLVYLLPRGQDKKVILSAIHNTFENRGTPLPKSFFEEAKKIDDLTFLEMAWPGVRILKNKSSFDDTWNALLECLKKLDEE